MNAAPSGTGSEIAAYPSRLSYLPGERLDLHCSCADSTFAVEIYRVGARSERVLKDERVQGTQHPVPDDVVPNGARWPVAWSFEIPGDWRSGFYEVQVRGERSSETAEAFFVVRSPQPGAHSRIVLALATNTYNAYNNWGGSSLYLGEHRVSFQRPLSRGFVRRPDDPLDRIVPPGRVDPDNHRLQAELSRAGYSWWSVAAGWHNWERRFVRWAEREGYSLDLVTNSDLEHYPDCLDGYQLMLSVGHDEYWSWPMRDTFDAFVADGGNAAFFSGNALFWQVRLEERGDAMVAYKYDAHELDPVVGTDQERLMTGIWSDRLIGRPETESIGVSFTRAGYARIGHSLVNGSGAYTVWRPDHWTLAGTGLGYGDLLGARHAIVSFEADGCELETRDGIPVPTGRDGAPPELEVVGTSPAHLWTADEFPKRIALKPGEPGELEFCAARLPGGEDGGLENLDRLARGQAVMGTFTRGGTVFTAGCTDWAYGLDGGDLALEQVTRNVLDRLSQPPAHKE